MLSLPVDKDTYFYKAKIAGFEPRTFWSLIAAVGCAAALSLVLRFTLDISSSSFVGTALIVIAAMPGVLWGFWGSLPQNPTGLEIEEFFPRWLEQNYGVRAAFYVSTPVREGLVSNPETDKPNKSFEWNRIKNIKGLELYRPTEVQLAAKKG